jgi:hypothetical protein
MTTLLVQDFIKTNTLGDLYTKHGVEVSFSKDGLLASFNYSQINAKNSDKLACQARGVILSRKDKKSIFDLKEYVVTKDKRDSSNVIFGDSIVVSYGFDRFFNQGQDTAFVNWQDKNLKVYEKLDGTCIFLYYFDGWKVATRKSPYADILIDEISKHTFSSLFKKALQETINMSFEDYTKTLNKDVTYVFELTTPDNRVVVVYDTYKVTLIGARNKKTFQELEIETINNLVPFVKSYNMNDVNAIIGFVNSLNPMDNEGVVVKDSNFNRVKIKNINYVAYNKAADLYGKSVRGIIQLILSEKEDDVIPYLSHSVIEKIHLYKDKLNKLVNYVDTNYKKYYNEVNSYPDSDIRKRKEFAQLISLNEKYSAPFFVIYSGKANSMSDYINRNKNKDSSWSDTFIDKLIEAFDTLKL